MNRMNFTDVENVVNGYAANGSRTKMGHNIVCVVSLKDSKVRAAGRYLVGHVAKATMVNHCTFPKYDSKLSAALGMKVPTGELRGMTWDLFPYIKRANKSGYRYLNIYYAMGDTRMETHTKWLYDGREATPQEVAEIERHLVSNNSNSVVSAVMYQIDPVNSWDGFYYFGESKAEAEKVFNEIGV